MSIRHRNANGRNRAVVCAAYVLACGALGVAGGLAAAAAPTTKASAAADTATTVFLPVADASVSEEEPTTLFGTGHRLRTDGDDGERFESVVRFDVSGLSGTVTSAMLRLFVPSDPTEDGPQVYPTTGGWDETTVSWTTRPAVTGGAVADFAAMPTEAWSEVEVTALVPRDGAINLLLAQSGKDGVGFYAHEKEGYEPQLVVTTSASPTTSSTDSTDSTTTTTTTTSTDTTTTTTDTTTTTTTTDATTTTMTTAPPPDTTTTTPTTTTAPPPDTTPPTTPTNFAVTGEAAESISVAWNESSDDVGVTEYGLYLNGTRVATTPSTSYTFTGLRCVTVYTLAVDAADAEGNRSEQTSLSASSGACPTGDPVITAAGDICNSTLNCALTAALVEQINPARALTLGDNAYNDGSLTQYNSYYNPNWGRFKSKTSPAPGNHEYHVSGAADYFTYFGSTLAPGPYYSYDVGSWHLISLASSSGLSPSAGGAEETWLKQDLAAHQNKCILAYWHEPRWSSGTTHGSSSSWSAVWNDLYAAHADVVLNGHEHNYERFAKQNTSGAADPNGIREFVVGTGGASHGYPFGTPLANSEVRNNTTWGVLKLTLHATGYDWEFVPVAGSTFTDSGSDSCS
jgi:hypothetical protein